MLTFRNLKLEEISTLCHTSGSKIIAWLLRYLQHGGEGGGLFWDAIFVRHFRTKRCKKENQLWERYWQNPIYSKHLNLELTNNIFLNSTVNIFYNMYNVIILGEVDTAKYISSFSNYNSYWTLHIKLCSLKKCNLKLSIIHLLILQTPES